MVLFHNLYNCWMHCVIYNSLTGPVVFVYFSAPETLTGARHWQKTAATQSNIHWRLILPLLSCYIHPKPWYASKLNLDGYCLSAVCGLAITCRLSRWEEEDEEPLLCTGVAVLLRGVEFLSSELMVRPWGPLWYWWWWDIVDTRWLIGPPSAPEHPLQHTSSR